MARARTHNKKRLVPQHLSLHATSFQKVPAYEALEGQINYRKLVSVDLRERRANARRTGLTEEQIAKLYAPVDSLPNSDPAEKQK
jgi:hypothetical protein